MRLRRADAALWLLVACIASNLTVMAQTIDEQRLARQHYRTGMNFLAAEAWKEAEREFSAAIELDPNFSMAHHGLGRAYMGMKSYQNAVRAYAACRDSFRAGAGRAATNGLELQQRRQEQLVVLKEWLREQRSGSMGRTPGQLQSQSVLAAQDQVLELERSLQRGPQMSADLAVPAFVSLALGSAHFRTGNLTEAERYYREAIDTNPKLGEAHNNLAVVYLEIGRIDLADQEVKLAEKAGYKVNPGLKDDIRKASR